MDLPSFLKALAAFSCFPADILTKAEAVASRLDNEQRAILCAALTGIHAECEHIEQQRSERIGKALDELTAMRHRFMPAIHAEVGERESEEALRLLTHEIDASSPSDS